jgi:ATP-dependent DNA helicase RecQ
VLLAGREDDDIAQYFTDSAFPPAAHMQAIVDSLNRSEGLTLARLEASVNLRRGQLAKALKLLEIDGAVAREGGTYFRTANRWRPDSDRVQRVTEARLRELTQMQRYVKHEGCLMEFLTSSLDDPASRPCGRCAAEGGDVLAAHVDRLLVREAVKFLRRDARPIPVRRQWPSNAVPELRGRIQPANCEGRALCVYGDAGYGRLVTAGKYVDGNFNAELLDASVELIRERWRPDPRPAWVTALPSIRHPGLVGAFAASLAARLGLPYHEALAASEGPAQKLMENSTQQVRNVARRLTITRSVPNGPVLLVDDHVDSRWTLTYAGGLLRRHGSGDVHPYALAVASARDDTDA